MTHLPPPYQNKSLSHTIKQWAKALGFADCGISHTDLSAYEADYFNWLSQDFHGEMHYMQAHGTKRTRPTELIAGTQSIISLRLNYFDTDAHSALEQLHTSDKAYISRYALGRDYHKVIRQKLKQLIQEIENFTPNAICRAFVDSAPVLERPIAKEAGLGFIGKNSLVIHPRAGSWFFLAEIYTNLPLEKDEPFSKQGCGPCRACIVECPTQAIIANGVVDARRCISYLTIEHKGAIPLEFREAMGNRIYGCDDCQLVCPWNHFTQPNQQPDFKPRHHLDSASLVELFNWNEAEFNQRFEGSPIRRIGYQSWLRNLVVALGNSCASEQKIALLEQKKGINDLIDEHLDWAIKQQEVKLAKNLAKNEPKVKRLEANLEANNIKPFFAKKYYLGACRTKPGEAK